VSVDGLEGAGAVFAVAAGVDDTVAVERADPEGGVDGALDVRGVAVGAVGVIGDVVLPVPVLIDLARVSEAVGENAVEGAGALKVLQIDGLDDFGVGGAGRGDQREHGREGKCGSGDEVAGVPDARGQSRCGPRGSTWPRRSTAIGPQDTLLKVTWSDGGGAKPVL
jgi:hypothetical protein